jgi:hypothetical protein
MMTHPKPQPSFLPGRRWKIGFDAVVRTVLVLAVVVMVNYLGGLFPERFYLSSQTRVELSPRTVSVLHSLTNHITVTLYYNKQVDFYPTVVERVSFGKSGHFREDRGLRARRRRSRKNQGTI